MDMTKMRPEDVSLLLEHVADCCCRYVASPKDTTDVKLIDARCIGAYLVPAPAEQRDPEAPYCVTPAKHAFTGHEIACISAPAPGGLTPEQHPIEAQPDGDTRGWVPPRYVPCGRHGCLLCVPIVDADQAQPCINVWHAQTSVPAAAARDGDVPPACPDCGESAAGY